MAPVTLADLATLPPTLMAFSEKPGQVTAADILGVSRTTIFEMLKDGRLPFIKTGSRGVRVPTQAVLDLLEHGHPRDADAVSPCPTCGST